MAAETKTFMAMKGAGYYSKATTGARDVILGAMPLILDAIDRMPLSERDPTAFRATDMGAADGGTSLDMWRQVLAVVRARIPSRAIEIVYTDLPRNDFSQLFRLLHGQTELASYLPAIDNLYAFASANSFHTQIVPSGTLDLGFSSTASHYVSRTPCEIPDHVHMVGASGAVREAYEEQGRQDWERFLLARAAELKPGGRLCLFNFGIDEAGRYLGHTGGMSMFETFDRLWKGMVADGLITEAEYRATNFPQVYRTREQFIAPLEDVASRSIAPASGSSMSESRVVDCPYARDFRAHGDAQRFAREYIPTLRSWSEPTFRAGLSGSRPAEQQASILDEYFHRYEAAVAAAPAGHGMDYVHIYLVCRKDP